MCIRDRFLVSSVSLRVVLGTGRSPVSGEEQAAITATKKDPHSTAYLGLVKRRLVIACTASRVCRVGKRLASHC